MLVLRELERVGCRQRQTAEVPFQNKEVKTLKLCLQNLSRNKFLVENPGTDSLVKQVKQPSPNRELRW